MCLECSTNCNYQARGTAYYNGQNNRNITSTLQSWLTTKLPSSYTINKIEQSNADMSNANNDTTTQEEPNSNQLIFMIAPVAFASIVFLILAVYTYKTVKRRKRDFEQVEMSENHNINGGVVFDEDDEDLDSIERPSDSWRNVYKSRPKGNYIQPLTTKLYGRSSGRSSGEKQKTGGDDWNVSFPVATNKMGHEFESSRNVEELEI